MVVDALFDTAGKSNRRRMIAIGNEPSVFAKFHNALKHIEYHVSCDGITISCLPQPINFVYEVWARSSSLISKAGKSKRKNRYFCFARTCSIILVGY